jgi:hypothetical protein
MRNEHLSNIVQAAADHLGFAIVLFLLGLLLILCIVLFRRNMRLKSEMENPIWVGQKLHAWSSFAGRSIRTPGASAREHALRVKLYVDYSNFFQYWRSIVEGAEHVDTLDWTRMPGTVLEAIKDQPIAQNRQVVYCGTNVYVSYLKDDYYDLLIDIKNGKEKSPYPLKVEVDEIESWRRENRARTEEVTRKLPFQFGFIVFPFARQTPEGLKNATFRADGVPPTREKLVDTSLCTDLIADAVGDLYDVALVLSADIDHSPAITLVQDEYKKVVGIVGMKGTARGPLSNFCKIKIDLNESKNGVPRYESMRLARTQSAAPQQQS